MSWACMELAFERNHPAAAGHFPGNPVIPGALLLDAVITAIAGAIRRQPQAVRSAKFLQIVRPGERLELRWQAAPDGGVAFECLAGGVPAASGRLAFAMAGETAPDAGGKAAP